MKNPRFGCMAPKRTWGGRVKNHSEKKKQRSTRHAAGFIGAKGGNHGVNPNKREKGAKNQGTQMRTKR